MKKIMLVIFSFLLFFDYITSFAQYMENDCGMIGNGPTTPSEVTDGEMKPDRSDKSNGIVVPEPNQMFFPILIVCVQFHGEEDDNSLWDWHPGNPPNYLDELISQTKITEGNWWDRYNGKLVSDWWQEVSCGKMHVVGNAYYIELDYTAGEYIRDYPDSMVRQRTINQHIWEKVTAIPGFSWQFFDKWKKENGLWIWGSGDGYIDMIYKVYRTNPCINGTYVLPHFSGYAYLSFDGLYGDPFIYDIPNSNLKINYDYGELGSGLTLQGHDRTHLCMNKSPMIDLMGHEHGHFIFGPDHIKHAKMNLGTSSDFFFSPWERIKCGYLSSTEVDYNLDNTTYTVNDFSARNINNPIILQLFIRYESFGYKEYFLISNRRKVSDFDRLMMGDTARRDAFRNINPEYGKGIYIYHIQRDLVYGIANKIDLECADGLWNWLVGPPQHPEWSDVDFFPYIYPNTVDRDHNDNVLMNNPNLNYVDGITSKSGGLACLFSKGKKHTCTTFGQPCNEATDRIYTNNNEVWISWAALGDRYDAWEIGYNEIFSPYSSPSTRDYDHHQSNIFVWYNEFNTQTNEAKFKIYRTGYGGYNETQILALTPPSRPMEIKHELFQYNGNCVPKITWSHNTEPDMLRDGDVKRYQVWKATASYMTIVPTNYVLIATVNIPISQIPYYIDYTVREYECVEFSENPPYGTEYPVRYKVKAVDKDDSISVFSDFTSTTGFDDGSRPIGSGGDNLYLNNSLPKEFGLKQNFPNPFNPTTNVQYDLPKDEFVTIKIYDITGREITKLVSEFKKAGSYIVSFNGSELASGIYFYRIVAGNFISVKRMVLIK